MMKIEIKEQYIPDLNSIVGIILELFTRLILWRKEK